METIRGICITNTASVINGSTDSEHMFAYFISLCDDQPQATLFDVFHQGITKIINWLRQLCSNNEPALNIILSNGER